MMLAQPSAAPRFVGAGNPPTGPTLRRGWGDNNGDTMRGPDERELADELDREVTNKGGLVALVVCLTVVGVMALAVFMDVLRSV